MCMYATTMKKRGHEFEREQGRRYIGEVRGGKGKEGMM